MMTPSYSTLQLEFTTSPQLVDLPREAHRLASQALVSLTLKNLESDSHTEIYLKKFSALSMNSPRVLSAKPPSSKSSMVRSTHQFSFHVTATFL